MLRYCSSLLNIPNILLYFIFIHILNYFLGKIPERKNDCTKSINIFNAKLISGMVVIIYSSLTVHGYFPS